MYVTYALAAGPNALLRQLQAKVTGYIMYFEHLLFVLLPCAARQAAQEKCRGNFRRLPKFCSGNFPHFGLIGMSFWHLSFSRQQRDGSQPPFIYLLILQYHIHAQASVVEFALPTLQHTCISSAPSLI